MKKEFLKELDAVNEQLSKMTKEKRKELAKEARDYASKNKFNVVHLTDKQLRVIVTALEVFYRMRSGQVGMAMDMAYRDKGLSYNETEAIENLVKSMAFKEIKRPNSYYGFSSPELKDGTLAYEIEKTLTEYLSVKNNDGYWGNGCNFNGPLRTTQEPLPIIEGFRDYKDFPLTRAQTRKILPHYHKNDSVKMWEAYDKLKLGLPKGEKYQIFTDIATEKGETWERVSVRITKPRKDTA